MVLAVKDRDVGRLGQWGVVHAETGLRWGLDEGASVMGHVRSRRLVTLLLCAVFLCPVFAALPARAELPWQPERWSWARNPLPIDAKTTRGSLLAVTSPRNLEHASGIRLTSLHLQIDTETQPEHVVFDWQATVANPSSRDYFAVAVVYFRTSTQGEIAIPLLAPLQANEDTFNPSWERRLRPGDPIPIHGQTTIDRREWQAFLRDGDGHAEIATGSRLPADKLQELQLAVPMVADRLQDRIRAGEQVADHLDLEVAKLRDRVKRLQEQLDRVEPPEPRPGQDGSLTLNFYGESEPKRTETDRVAQTLEGFANLYGALGANTIIATLPDPIDSPFAREFDLLLAAIREAAEHCGYVFDRRYLPWTAGADDPVHRREPGVLLFRAPAPGARTSPQAPPCSKPLQPSGSRDLAILLVGERPDTGIQVAALERALDLSAELQDCACDLRSRILGPTFSGTRASLRQGLVHWSERNHRAQCTIQFDLVSGSATAESNQKFFQGPRADGEPGRPPECDLDDKQPCFSYQSMAIDDRRTWEHVQHYLEHSLDIPSGSTALLIESSLYGDEFTRKEDNESTRKENSVLACPVGSTIRGKPHLMRFPMHIAQLRADLASRENRQKPEDALVNRDRFVEIDSKGQPQRSSWQPFAPGLTSPTANVILATMLERLIAYRIEAVGILASDVQDKIFLAQQIHQHAPNVRIFTFEGDVLLTHPHVAEHTRGMIVASSHSLEISDESPKHRHPATSRLHTGKMNSLHYHFANDWSHGAFLALLK